VVENGVTEAPDAQDMGDILRRLGAPVLGVVFTGEELSRNQRRVLESGMAASGTSHSAITAGSDDEPEPEGVTETGDDVDLPAPELHPS